MLGSLASLLETDLLVSDPSVLLLERVLLDELWSLGDNGSGDLAILGLWTVWVSSDCLMGSSVDSFEALSLEGLRPSGELLIEGSLILLLQLVEVLLDMNTEDVLSVLINTEHFLSLNDFVSLSSSLVGGGFGLLQTESWESLLRVRDVESSVAGTLHGSEDTVSSGGAHETNIKEGLEWALLLTTLSNVVVGSIDLAVSSELSVQSLKLKESTGAEESGGVGRGVVGETALNTVSLELGGVGGHDSHISIKGGVDNLGDYSTVGASDDKSVLLGVVLVLVVDDESLTSVVVSLSLSSSAELGLISLGVSLVLKNLHECHLYLYLIND